MYKDSPKHESLSAVDLPISTKSYTCCNGLGVVLAGGMTTSYLTYGVTVRV